MNQQNMLQILHNPAGEIFIPNQFDIYIHVTIYSLAISSPATLSLITLYDIYYNQLQERDGPTQKSYILLEIQVVVVGALCIDIL
jgi:hypothetical protein